MRTPGCAVIIMNAAICYHDRNDSRKSDLISVFILVLAREGGRMWRFGPGVGQ